MGGSEGDFQLNESGVKDRIVCRIQVDRPQIAIPAHADGQVQGEPVEQEDGSYSQVFVELMVGGPYYFDCSQRCRNTS